MKKFFILLVVITSIVVSGCNSNPESSSLVNNSNKGIIEGSLTYPSHSIPQDLKVCADNIETKSSYCTQNHLKDKKYTHGLGYSLEVPAGNYQVYALHPIFDENGKKTEKHRKAYYTEFTKCGQTPECAGKSHDPLIVEVKVSEVISDISPLEDISKDVRN